MVDSSVVKCACDFIWSGSGKEEEQWRPSLAPYFAHPKWIGPLVSWIWHRSSRIHTESHKGITSPSVCYIYHLLSRYLKTQTKTCQKCKFIDYKTQTFAVIKPIRNHWKTKWNMMSKFQILNHHHFLHPRCSATFWQILLHNQYGHIMSQYIPFNYRCLFKDLDSSSASKVEMKGPCLPPSKLIKYTIQQLQNAPVHLQQFTWSQSSRRWYLKGICYNSNDYRD